MVFVQMLDEGIRVSVGVGAGAPVAVVGRCCGGCGGDEVRRFAGGGRGC